MYEVSLSSWWLLFFWGAIGWVAVLAIALVSGRYCARVDADMKIAKRRAFAATILPPPAEPSARPRETSWRDSHLPTQVHPPSAPTRSYTPAQVRAAHIHSRK